MTHTKTTHTNTRHRGNRKTQMRKKREKKKQRNRKKYDTNTTSQMGQRHIWRSTKKSKRTNGNEQTGGVELPVAMLKQKENTQQIDTINIIYYLFRANVLIYLCYWFHLLYDNHKFHLYHCVFHSRRTFQTMCACARCVRFVCCIY